MTDTAETPTPPAEARIVSDKPREKFVPLEYPVDSDGKLYEEIRIHRVSGKEMAEFFDRVRGHDGFVMPPMVDCPPEVWEALDADDQMTIDEAAQAFMPKRLKGLQDIAAAVDAAG